SLAYIRARVYGYDYPSASIWRRANFGGRGAGGGARARGGAWGEQRGGGRGAGGGGRGPGGAGGQGGARGAGGEVAGGGGGGGAQGGALAGEEGSDVEREARGKAAGGGPRAVPGADRHTVGGCPSLMSCAASACGRRSPPAARMPHSSPRWSTSATSPAWPAPTRRCWCPPTARRCSPPIPGTHSPRNATAPTWSC